MNPPIYQFHPDRSPIVQYPPSLGVHLRWVSSRRNTCTYGEALFAARLESKSHCGLICLEHDVAVPFESWLDLFASVLYRPERVMAVPYLLYPASTRLDCAVWAHRVRGPDGKLTFVPSWRNSPDKIAAFSLGCTYLPGSLLDAMPEDLRQWDYPRLDTLLSELAREHKIEMASLGRPAVHLHF